MTKILKGILITGLSLLVSTLFLINLTPPIGRDALTHHLTVPKLYLQHGGIYEIKELIFSYYPMNLDLLYMIPLWFKQDIIPKHIHFFFALGTTWLIFNYIKNRLGTNWALTGALLFLSTPIVIHLGTTAYVDLGVVFFTTAATLLLLRWGQERSLKLLVFSGIVAGLAAGTKYNGLITIFLLTCLVPFVDIHNLEKASSAQKKPIKNTLTFLTVALLTVSPWFLRNVIWTGNPVYPLLNSLFNTETTTIAQGMNPLLTRKLLYNESLWQILLLPIRIFFEGEDNNPQYFDGVLNPFILLFIAASFIPNSRITQKDSIDKKIFVWFSILFIVFAFVQRVIRIRYITPVLPFLIILSILGLYNLNSYLSKQEKHRLAKTIPTLLLLAAFTINGTYIFRYWQKINPIDYLSGNITRADFISRFWPEYPLVQFANHNLSPSATILAIFLGNRGYYFEREVHFDFKSGKSYICTLARGQDTARGIAISLEKDGFTHILVRKDLFMQWTQKNLTEEQIRRLNAFFTIFTEEIALTDTHTLLTLRRHQSL